MVSIYGVPIFGGNTVIVNSILLVNITDNAKIDIVNACSHLPKCFI